MRFVTVASTNREKKKEEFLNYGPIRKKHCIGKDQNTPKFNYHRVNIQFNEKQ